MTQTNSFDSHEMGLIRDRVQNIMSIPSGTAPIKVAKNIKTFNPKPEAKDLIISVIICVNNSP